MRPGAPLVFAGAPGNVAYDTHIGDKQETDKAFAGAAHTVRIKIVNPRVVANYMEPRSAVGEYDATSGRFMLNAGSQGVHILQGLIAENPQDPDRELARRHPRRRRRLRHQKHASIANIRSFSRRRDDSDVPSAGSPTAASISLATLKGATM